MTFPGFTDSLIASLFFAAGQKSYNQLNNSLRNAIDKTIAHFSQNEGLEIQLEHFEAILNGEIGEEELSKFISGEKFIDGDRLALQFAVFGGFYLEDESQILDISRRVFEHFKTVFTNELLKDPLLNIIALQKILNIQFKISQNEREKLEIAFDQIANQVSRQSQKLAETMQEGFANNELAFEKSLQKILSKELKDAYMVIGEHKKENYQLKKENQALKMINPSHSKGVSIKDTIQISSEVEKINPDDISKLIEKAELLMNGGKFPEANNLLFSLFKELEGKAEHNEEFARICSDLGGTYLPPASEVNYDEAIKFINIALEKKPTSWKAKLNLAVAYIFRNENDDYTIGRVLLNEVWQTNRNADVLRNILGAIAQYESLNALIDFIDECEADVKDFIENNVEILEYLAGEFLYQGDQEEALSYVDKALKISETAELYFIKAQSLQIRAYKTKLIPSSFDIIPKFNDYNDIKTALNLFMKACEILEEQNKEQLQVEIDYGITNSLLWLGRYEEAERRLTELNIELLEVGHIQNIDRWQLALLLWRKNFEAAYFHIISSDSFSQKSFYEKRDIVRILINHGAVEQAMILLDSVEHEAESIIDLSYWLDVSMLNIYLGNKMEATYAIRKSKQLARDNNAQADYKKVVYSNYIAFMDRYNETERVLLAMKEYQEEFPEEKLNEEIKAIDEEGNPSQEMLEMLDSNKKHYDNIKNMYSTKTIPTYLLEKLFRCSYIELITNKVSSDFTIQYSAPGATFNSVTHRNFGNAKGFVLDYSFLLDLTRMNLLSFLRKLNKPLYIHEKLFQKIQGELLKKEVFELRQLWNFLRKSSFLRITKEIMNFTLHSQNLEKSLDVWLVESMKFAKMKDFVFLSNDLKLLELNRSLEIKLSNITPFLNILFQNNFIEKVDYISAKGQLAERFYTFLSVTGEELFVIVMEDGGKITKRSTHIANQVFLEISHIDSFIGMFADFTQQLWGTDLMTEDKIEWIKFLTDISIQAIKRSSNKDDEKTRENANEFFGRLWSEAINNGNGKDLEELQKIVDVFLGGDNLVNFRKTVHEQIIEKMDKFTLGKTEA